MKLKVCRNPTKSKSLKLILLGVYILLGSAYITVDESSSEGSDSAVSSSDSEEDVASRSNSNNSSSDSEDSDNSNPFSTKSESKRPTI